MIGKWLNYGLACLYIEYYASGVLQFFFLVIWELLVSDKRVIHHVFSKNRKLRWKSSKILTAV